MNRFYMGSNGNVPFGQPQQVSNVFEQNNKVNTIAEEMQWSWYDRFTLDTTVTEHLMFQTPNGQGGKTFADTNMVLGGQIPKGKSFVCMAFKIRYQSNQALTAANAVFIGQMLQETSFKFQMDSKESFWTQSLAEIMGYSIFGAEAAANNFIAVSKMPGVYPLNIPIRLSEQDSFSVKIVHHTAVNTALDDDKVKISLDGIQYRNI